MRLPLNAILRSALAVTGVVLAVFGGAAARDAGPALQITDYAAMPATGTLDSDSNSGSVARVNFMREEPGGRRFFINDLNGPLYLFDKDTKKFTTYLNFNGSGSEGGLFRRFTYAAGFANGFISFQFDPDYSRNGRFYTIHLEDVEAAGPALPDNTKFPGLELAGYAPTPPMKTPGEIDREAVVIEWTDSNISNATFEGRAREVMRVQLNTRIHPMGDLVFNPTARRGDPDWRVLYIGCGDGGSGEQRTIMRMNPQRLDTLVGKILRIVPDLSEHTDSSTVSENGRYRIPRDNPFAAVEGARTEIWAYGLRNPHRLTWDADPDRPADNHLLAATIGLHTWESVYIVRKGANYGYSEREGPELLNPDNTTGPVPEVDRIPVRVSDVVSNGTIAPTYPVIAYPHRPGGGDAIAGGFVYRGKLVPALHGKYVFGDISTGRIWYADYTDLIAADDGKPATLAAMHELSVSWNDPNDSPDAGSQIYPSMWPVVSAAYHFRGGKDPDLPGRSTVSGPGRVDIRFAVDADGELYVLSKSDGMIRKVVGTY
jgi:hypothetical protein